LYDLSVDEFSLALDAVQIFYTCSVRRGHSSFIISQITRYDAWRVTSANLKQTELNTPFIDDSRNRLTRLRALVKPINCR
jgi:hypothetical protein